MSGFGDFLFGSEGEPSRIEDVTPEAFRNLRDPVSRELSRLLGSRSRRSAEGRQTVAPLGEREQQILDSIFSATQDTGFTQAGREALTQTAQGQFLSPESNPFLEQTIQTATRPLIEAFERTTLPNLRNAFTQAGQTIQPTAPGESGSSPFEAAVLDAQRDLTRTVGDVSTRIASENFQAERDRQQQAAAAAPGFEAGELQNLVQGLQAQALPRLIEQHGVDQGLKLFQQEIDNLLNIIRIAGSLSSPQPAEIAGTQGSTGVAGPLAQGAGLALGAMAFSDRRLKRDIVRVGELRKLPLYLFRYLWENDYRIGFMADDVEKVKPEAVTEILGFKAIDYSRLF